MIDGQLNRRTYKRKDIRTNRQAWGMTGGQTDKDIFGQTEGSKPQMPHIPPPPNISFAVNVVGISE